MAKCHSSSSSPFSSLLLLSTFYIILLNICEYYRWFDITKHHYQTIWHHYNYKPSIFRSWSFWSPPSTPNPHLWTTRAARRSPPPRPPRRRSAATVAALHGPCPHRRTGCCLSAGGTWGRLGMGGLKKQNPRFDQQNFDGRVWINNFWFWFILMQTSEIAILSSKIPEKMK